MPNHITSRDDVVVNLEPVAREIEALESAPTSYQHENDGEYDDVLLAERVRHSYKDELVKSGAQWFYHDAPSGLWKADPYQARVRNIVEQKNRVYSQLSKFDERVRRYVLSAKKIDDVVKIISQGQFYEDEGGFDTNPDIAGLPDGKCVELKTGTIRKTERKDRLTMAALVHTGPWALSALREVS